MKHFLILIGWIMTAGMVCAAPVIERSSLAKFEKNLEALRKRYDIPGMSAALAQEDKLVWEKGFGFTNLELQTKATPESVYHLASLTKPFASVVLLQLWEEGKLDLDAPVESFGVQFTNSGVTIRHLLSHTSEGVPGSAFKYNGARFRSLDIVIQKLTGHGFARELHDRILLPVRLEDTSPTPAAPADCAEARRDPDKIKLRLAQGYQPNGKTPIAYRTNFSSSAGLVSTARDVAQFSLALDAGKLLRPETLQLAWSPSRSATGEPLAYGLGWFIYQREKSKIIWHYGWWDGVSSLIVKIPEQKLTFVLLANSDMLSRPFNLGGDSNIYRSKFGKTFLDTFYRQ